MLLPLHNGATKVALVKLGVLGGVNKIVDEVVHVLASVTCIVYVPAINALNTFDPWFVPPLMLYWYNTVPPVAVTVMLPLLLGTHVGFTLAKLVI